MDSLLVILGVLVVKRRHRQYRYVMLWPTPIHVVTAAVCAVPVCSVVTDTDIRSDSSNMGSIWGGVRVAVWDEWVNSITLMNGIPGI